MGWILDDKKELDRILAQEGYGIIENGQVLDSLPPLEKTELDKQLSSERRKSERERLENKFRLVAIGCAMEHGLREIGWSRNFAFDRPDSGMEFDFSLPDLKIAVEVNGGQGLGDKSGHGSWTGLERDARKQNAAVRRGWTLFWLTTSMVNAEHVQPIIDFIVERMRENNADLA